jgi:hypothetical protein
MNKKRIGFLWVVVVVIGLAFMGCGNGDNGNGGHQFVGKVIDFASGKAAEVPVPDMTVKALDDSTGEELGNEVVSDESGMVYFDNLPQGRVGFKAVGKAGASIDTYQFNIDSSAQDELLWSVDNNTYLAAPAMAGYVQLDTLGAAAGATYWLDAEGKEIPVGCSSVQGSFDSGDIRYFGDNGMPTDPASRADVNPLNGYWLVGNIVPVNSAVTLEGYVDDLLLGSVRYFTYPKAVSIGNIYYEGAENPQPAGCE